MKENRLERFYQYLMRYEATQKMLLEDKVFSHLRIGREKAGFYDEKIPRILIFGSFKAGKSAFINAFTGRKLAAVGPFEKTSWVARYWPTEKEFCHIERKDGSIEKISVSEFVKNTQDDLYDMESLLNIYRVDIGYLGTGEKVAFIDTPGFGATEENELRAIESVADADLIFYLVDVNKLGKLREKALIDKIRESKVPMVCIATKYDGDIAEDVAYDKVKKMVAKHTEFQENEIYPVSVKNYLAKDEDSYFETILELCKQIEIHKTKHRKAAWKANLFRQSNSLLAIFQRLRGEMNGIMEKKMEFQNQFFHYQKMIQDELAVFIKDYVRRTLYAGHRENIVLVTEVTIKMDDEKRNRVLSEVLPKNYMENYLGRLSTLVYEKHYELWGKHIANLSKGKKEGRADLFEHPSFSDVNFSDMEVIRSLGHSEEMFRKNGMKLSLGIAGFASFYEAVLGANAASVVLSGAVITTGLPLVAGGLMLTGYLLKQTRESGETRSVIRGAIEKEIRKQANEIADFCISRVDNLDRKIFKSYLSRLDVEIQEYFPSGKPYVKEVEECDGIITELSELVSSMELSEDATNEELFILKKNKKLEEEYQEMMAEIDKIKRTHLEELRNRDEKIHGLVVDNRSLLLQIEGKNKELSNLIAYRQEKEVEINRLKQKKTELEKDKEKNEREITVLIQDINSKERELQDKLFEIKRLETDRRKLEETNEKKGLEIEKLNQERIEKEESYQSQISEKQDELEHRMKENFKLKEEIEGLKSQESILDGKKKFEQEICKRLDAFVFQGDNVLKLTTEEGREELIGGLEDLILFTDEDLELFMKDLKNILKKGIQYKTNGLQIISLIQGKYIVSREKRYKAYCLLEGNRFTVKCVDVWRKDADRYLRYKNQLTQAPVLVDDELKYRIFDEIRRAKRQIVIAVPWITQKAWEEKGNYRYSFEEVISDAIHQNKELKVYILTGNSGDLSSQFGTFSAQNGNIRDEETQFMIEKIKKKFIKNAKQIVIYGDCIIHDKILVVDDSFRMVGSYNMLSNQGIYGYLKERQGETMEMNENPENVKNTLKIAASRAKQRLNYFLL